MVPTSKLEEAIEKGILRPRDAIESLSKNGRKGSRGKMRKLAKRALDSMKSNGRLLADNVPDKFVSVIDADDMKGMSNADKIKMSKKSAMFTNRQKNAITRNVSIE